MNCEKNFQKRSVLILAGNFKSKINNFKLPPYLLNIGSTLSIEKILKNLELSQNDTVYLAINNDQDKFIRFSSFNNLVLINVSNSETIIETISRSLKFINGENIEIIPITTIPDVSCIPIKSVVFSLKPIPKENWSSISTKEGKVKYIFKNSNYEFSSESFPFTGRIFANLKDLETSLYKVKNNDKNDLLYLAKVLIDEFEYKIFKETWYDIGHNTTYLETKLTSINKRFFNSIEYNPKNDTLIKSSYDRNKLQNELIYYKNLPLPLKRYFPHIYTKSLENIKSIEMEFIPFPNLAETYLFRDDGPNNWIRIVKSIKIAYDQFYKKDNLIRYDNINYLYSKKLESRYKELKENYLSSEQDMLLNKFVSKGLILNNNIKLPSLNFTINKLLNNLRLYEVSKPLFIGHGDLCFNNILVDPNSGSLKLIDPKAYPDKSKNIVGLVDPFYDLAKLNHSFTYLYDSIVNNLYKLNFKDNEINLKIYAPNNYYQIKNLFCDQFEYHNIEKKLLRSLTSNLFLSMLPLHCDDSNRMLALAIVGNVIFNNIDFENLIIKL
tara:strand:+ start:2844 stop:4499 length:1656 start_codon:yes stop_codon:yes gene_type:complete